MSAAAQKSAAGKFYAQVLHRAGRPEVAVVVRETHDAVRVGNVKELRIWSRRVEREAEGLVQARLGKNLVDLRFAVVVGIVQDANAARPALGDENIAVRRGEQEAWVLEPRGVQFDLEPGGNVRMRAVRGTDFVRAVPGGIRAEGRRQFVEVDAVFVARGVVGPVTAEGGEVGGGFPGVAAWIKVILRRQRTHGQQGEQTRNDDATGRKRHGAAIDSSAGSLARGTCHGARKRLCRGKPAMPTTPFAVMTEFRPLFYRVRRGWLLAGWLFAVVASTGWAGTTTDLDNQNGLPTAQLGAPLKSFQGLNKTEDTGRWLSFTRSGDRLEFEGHGVKSITYNFFKEKLYSIFLDVDGKGNVKGLIKTLERNYGKQHSYELHTYPKTAAEVEIREWAGTRVYCVYKNGADNNGGVLTFLDKPTWDALQIPKKEKEAQSRDMLKGSFINGDF